MEKVFLDTLEASYTAGLKLDFIVCPDIVAGGEESLGFSVKWATGRLLGTPRLALVVQDGMTEQMVDAYVLSLFTHIFIGGTVEWKWKTADSWVKFAHKNNKKCHIGQVGRLQYLKFAEHIQTDSVDSTSFAVNDSWHIIEQFRNPLLNPENTTTT